MTLTRKVLGEPVPVSLCRPQIPYGLGRDRTLRGDRPETECFRIRPYFYTDVYGRWRTRKQSVLMWTVRVARRRVALPYAAGFHRPSPEIKRVCFFRPYWSVLLVLWTFCGVHIVFCAENGWVGEINIISFWRETCVGHKGQTVPQTETLPKSCGMRWLQMWDVKVSKNIKYICYFCFSN
jgi:hypothetical protein